MRSKIVLLGLAALIAGCNESSLPRNPRGSGPGAEDAGGRQGWGGHAGVPGSGGRGGAAGTAASESSGGTAGGAGAGGSGTSAGGSASGGTTGGGGATARGGAMATGGVAGAGGNASGGVDAAGGKSIELPPAICSRRAVAGSPVLLELGTGLDPEAKFAAITPDERTLVWTVRDRQELTVTYLDRTDPDAGFASPRRLALSAGDDQVALSPDGLELVYVSEDGQTFQVQARATRTDAFEDVTKPVHFDLLNDPSVLPGLRYAEPVYGSGSLSFYFASPDDSGARVRYRATRPSSADRFEPPRKLTLPAATSGSIPRLTGVSQDDQTLFLWDEATSQTLWVFLDLGSFRYGDFVLLGEFGPAQPNAACSRLYASPAPGKIVAAPLE